MARVALALVVVLLVGMVGLMGAHAQVGPVGPLPSISLPDLLPTTSPTAPDVATPTPTLPLTPTPSLPFTPSPSPSDEPEERYNRSVSLSLRKHLVARGKVEVVDSIFELCVADVPLRVERRRADGSWRLLKRASTDDVGKYRVRLKDRTGRYRALVTETSAHTQTPLATVCLPARSAVQRHRH